jgi:hypothetical protein
MKDCKGHGSNKRFNAAHQSGVMCATAPPANDNYPHERTHEEAVGATLAARFAHDDIARRATMRGEPTPPKIRKASSSKRGV